MPLANRDRRQPIEKPIHDLHRGLRRRVANAASDEDRSVPIATADAGTSEVLREAADQANGRRRAERRQIVVIDLVAQAGVTNLVQFRQENLFTADFTDATVITLYLLPDLNVKLRPKLWNELKPGTRIVSHQFEMGSWKPEKKLESNGRTIYFWTVPPKDKQPKLSEK